MVSAAKTPWPWTRERRRTIFGSIAGGRGPFVTALVTPASLLRD